MPFQNVLFLKEVLACNGCFGLFIKINNLILYQQTKFQCYIYFPSQESNKMRYYVLIQTVNDVINFKIYLGSISKALADRDYGEDGNTKI